VLVVNPVDNLAKGERATADEKGAVRCQRVTAAERVKGWGSDSSYLACPAVEKTGGVDVMRRRQPRIVLIPPEIDNSVKVQECGMNRENLRIDHSSIPWHRNSSSCVLVARR